MVFKRWCPVHYRNCITYINEITISATDRCILHDGYFVRVDITGLRRTINYEVLSAFFDVSNDDLGMEHVEHHGVAFFTRGSGNLVITGPPARGTPCHGRDHALYWICAAWFSNVVLGYLLRGLCRDDRQPAAQGLPKKHRRIVRKEGSANLKMRKTFLFAYLVLYGQCEPCTGLMLMTDPLPAEHMHADLWTSSPAEHFYIEAEGWHCDPCLYIYHHLVIHYKLRMTFITVDCDDC